MQTPQEILEPAALYLGIFLIGLIPMFLFNVFASILRGLGDSRSPLRYLAYATVLNIVLDPIMIFGVGPIPALGIKGVALATVISQTLSAVLLLVQMVRNTDLISLERSAWRLDGGLIVKMFRIGIPAGLQTMIVSFSMIILAAIVNGFGPTVVASFGAAQRLDQFAFMPALSVSFAVTALVGQNLGAGKYEHVREILRWGNILTGAITAVVTLVVILAPTPLLAVFTRDTGVLSRGRVLLADRGPLLHSARPHVYGDGRVPRRRRYRRFADHQLYHHVGCAAAIGDHARTRIWLGHRRSVGVDHREHRAGSCAHVRLLRHRPLEEVCGGRATLVAPKSGRPETIGRPLRIWPPLSPFAQRGCHRLSDLLADSEQLVVFPARDERASDPILI